MNKVKQEMIQLFGYDFINNFVTFIKSFNKKFIDNNKQRLERKFKSKSKQYNELLKKKSEEISDHGLTWLKDTDQKNFNNFIANGL